MIKQMSENENTDQEKVYVIRVGSKGSELGYIDQINRDLDKRNEAWVSAMFSGLDTLHRLLDYMLKHDDEQNHGKKTLFMTIENGRTEYTVMRDGSPVKDASGKDLKRMGYFNKVHITRNGSQITESKVRATKGK